MFDGNLRQLSETLSQIVENGSLSLRTVKNRPQMGETISTELPGSLSIVQEVIHSSIVSIVECARSVHQDGCAHEKIEKWYVDTEC